MLLGTTTDIIAVTKSRIFVQAYCLFSTAFWNGFDLFEDIWQSVTWNSCYVTTTYIIRGFELARSRKIKLTSWLRTVKTSLLVLRWLFLPVLTRLSNFWKYMLRAIGHQTELFVILWINHFTVATKVLWCYWSRAVKRTSTVTGALLYLLWWSHQVTCKRATSLFPFRRLKIIYWILTSLRSILENVSSMRMNAKPMFLKVLKCFVCFKQSTQRFLIHGLFNLLRTTADMPYFSPDHVSGCLDNPIFWESIFSTEEDKREKS